MRSKLTTFIFIGMLGGIAVGYACNMLWPDPQTAKSISGYISLISDIFLRLIKMIIAPLVFSTSWSASPIWATPPRSAASAPRPWRGSSAPP